MQKILDQIYFWSTTLLLGAIALFIATAIVVGVIGCTLYDCREFYRLLFR